MIDEKTLLAQELARTLVNFRRAEWHQVSHHGLRQSEFFLLVTLKHFICPDTAGLKASELSKRLQISRAGVTQMINALGKTGHIERLIDPNDRRAVLIKLTAEGEKIVKVMQDKFLQDLQALVSYLGENDSRELIRILASTFTFFKERRKDNAEKSQT